jgi:tetratricopeptide (TPR) repeat protein
VHLSVGKVFEVGGNLEQATLSYRKALEADPGFVAARFALVNVSNQLGDTKGALSEAKELVKQVPENGEARLLLAKALMAAKDYKGAEPELVKATELLPENADAHAYLAAINFANGKDQVALEEYKKALALQPDNAVWRSDHALLLARLGRAEEGLEELRKVVDVPGYNDPAGFVNMGYLYRNMKPPKAKEAVAAYLKALQMNPGKEMAAQANLGLAWAYVALGQHDQAIEAYDQVNQLDPKLAPEAFNGAGWCYLRKGDLDQAEAMVAKAKAAGRADSLLEDWVTKNKHKRASDAQTRAEILDEIERLEKEAKWWEKLDEDLRDKKPAVRLRSVTKILEKPGKEAAARLAYCISQDEDYEVREAATSALLAMPKHAAPAIPYVKANLNLNCQPPITETSQIAFAIELKCEDLKTTSRQVLKKLGSQ